MQSSFNLKPSNKSAKLFRGALFHNR